MSAQVNNNNFTNIGRMFARQNVPGVYGRQKIASEAGAEVPPEQVDRVSLSPFAPRPLNASLVRDAFAAAKTMETGGRLSQAQGERLREDRIFAAVAALATLGGDDVEPMRRNWPGGLPVPSSEELEVARRRLAQRLDQVDEVEDGAVVQEERVGLLQRIGRRDLTAIGPPADDVAGTLAAAS